LASIRFRAWVFGSALLALAAPAAAEVRVALLPVAVHASGSDSGYLRDGLGDMLSARLEQYEGLEVLRPAVDAVAPGAREQAVAHGRAVGADFVLYGSFTRFGEGASLDLRCARVQAEGAEAAGDEARRIFIQAGTLAEIIPDLETLAGKVARFASGARSTPPLRGAGPAAAEGSVDAARFEELAKRVEALERALYAPVAQGAAAPPAREPAGDGAASVVR
jgi:TolB-like protein